VRGRCPLRHAPLLGRGVGARGRERKNRDAARRNEDCELHGFGEFVPQKKRPGGCHNSGHAGRPENAREDFRVSHCTHQTPVMLVSKDGRGRLKVPRQHVQRV